MSNQSTPMLDRWVCGDFHDPLVNSLEHCRPSRVSPPRYAVMRVTALGSLWCTAVINSPISMLKPSPVGR
jgi:hypothetical protein